MFPFYSNLKTPENLWFSGLFREYKIEILAKNGLRDCRHISLLSAFEGMNDFLFLPKIIRKTTENLNQKHNLVTIP